jgi:hypothetical protein
MSPTIKWIWLIGLQNKICLTSQLMCRRHRHYHFQNIRFYLHLLQIMQATFSLPLQHPSPELFFHHPQLLSSDAFGLLVNIWSLHVLVSLFEIQNHEETGSHQFASL